MCIGLVGFALFGPDALMSGAGAIDVGNRRTAVLATGIINGMGSVGSVLQEILLGKLLERGGTNAAFGAIFVSSVAAAACLGVLLARGRMGRAHL